MKTKKLLFVYNANSGVSNAILDSMHKVFSPSTYDCNLCDITFGIVSENNTWKKFREESELQMDFLHKDEFQNDYPSVVDDSFDFPIVLSEDEKGLTVFITTKELNALQTAEELIQLVNERV
ncbi:GTPase [Flagellimonas sp. 2504JD4-2]